MKIALIIVLFVVGIIALSFSYPIYKAIQIAKECSETTENECDYYKCLEEKEVNKGIPLPRYDYKEEYLTCIQHEEQTIGTNEQQEAQE